MDKRYKTPGDPLDFKHITETKQRSGTNKTRKYTYDDTTPGRPPMETRREPPPDFDFRDPLMRTLTPYGWYKEIATRLLRETNAANYAELEEAAAQGLAPVSDPEEMDRLMCRTKPVAVVRDPADLKVAL